MVRRLRRRGRKRRGQKLLQDSRRVQPNQLRSRGVVAVISNIMIDINNVAKPLRVHLVHQRREGLSGSITNVVLILQLAVWAHLMARASTTLLLINRVQIISSALLRHLCFDAVFVFVFINLSLARVKVIN